MAGNVGSGRNRSLELGSSWTRVLEIRLDREEWWHRNEEKEEVITVVTLHVVIGRRWRRTRRLKEERRCLCFPGLRETRGRVKRVAEERKEKKWARAEAWAL